MLKNSSESWVPSPPAVNKSVVGVSASKQDLFRFWDLVRSEVVDGEPALVAASWKEMPGASGYLMLVVLLKSLKIPSGTGPSFSNNWPEGDGSSISDGCDHSETDAVCNGRRARRNSTSFSRASIFLCRSRQSAAFLGTCH